MYFKIEELKPTPGSRTKKKRLGRGPGSGLGKTSGRGHKGAGARGKGKVKPGFEGGQTPLYRRVPKKGFTNGPFKTIHTIINLSALENFFEANDVVTVEVLLQKKIIKNVNDGIKVLGKGELTKPLTVKVHAFSQSAKEKIEAAGGNVEVIQ
jgi:large subunit ribosomal protein L15